MAAIMAAIRPDDEILTISSAYRPPTRPVWWTGVPLVLVLVIEKALRAGKKILVPCASNTFFVQLVDYLSQVRRRWQICLTLHVNRL